MRENRTRLLEHLLADAKLLGESFSTLDLLHELSAGIMLAMPLELLGRLAVEDESDRILALALGVDLVHLTGDIVSSSELKKARRTEMVWSASRASIREKGRGQLKRQTSSQNR
jgi:hypothetical protein